MSARLEDGALWDEAPGRVTLNGRLVDRRAFLGALALTAAGAALSPGRAGATMLAGPGVAGQQGLSQLATAQGTWHVDDMWGHWPRYAQPIPYTLVRHVPISLDTVAPVDRHLLM